MEPTEYELALREQLLHDNNNMEMWSELYSEIQKADWTTAFIDTLPDMSFAVVSPGGEKDGDGKTEPRDLRKLAHHNETVKSASENDSVDWVHLVKAIANVSQMDATDEEKTKAKTHLDKHYEALKADNLDQTEEDGE